MQLSVVVVVALSLLTRPLFTAAVPLKTVDRFAGETKPHSYIVTLKSDVPKESYLIWLGSNVTYADWDVLHGFAGMFNPQTLDALRANEGVESIAEDGVMSINAVVTQNNAPWGLNRISQSAPLTNRDPSALTYTYTYDSSAGSGVDIYVLDTGIYIANQEFNGRATWGATFGGYRSVDGNGHGTHCSGTAAGTRYGVAKAAKLIAVKVLSDSGTGYVSDIIAGLNFVSKRASTSRRPTIASMSLGGSVSSALDSAVASLTNKGIHVAVAAGNSNADAVNYSPARTPSAVTVGATTINDARASFSNFGSVVDIFAPGQNIISSWIGSKTATKSISGTSMATPHIAGLIATLISRDGNVTPMAMSIKISSLSTKNVLTDIPPGTVNALAKNEF